MNLQEHIMRFGKDRTWLELAQMYNYRPDLSDDKRADKARKTFGKLQKAKEGIHIVLGCVHVPYHNAAVLQKIQALIKEYNILGFHLIGDFLDLKSLSKHDENTSPSISLGKEYLIANQVLDSFDKVLPNGCIKTYLYGNHEDRFFRFKNNLKNQGFADAIKSPTEALSLNLRGYTVLSNWQEDYFNVGDYQIFHGVYCSTNPAKAHLDKVKNNCIFAHTYRSSVWIENGQEAINTGHLADVSNTNGFGYVSRIEKIKWQSGFVIINQQNEFYQANLIPVKNNSFCFGAKRY